MLQSSSRIALGGRLPAPPPSRRIRPSVPYSIVRTGISGISTGMASPPPSGDWAALSRHNYGPPVPYPPPARPEQIQRRWSGQYGVPGYYRPVFGMGYLGATAQQDVQSAGSLATAGATIGAAAAGATALIPFIGPAIAAVTLGITAILNSGCGNTCIVTSNWANQAEALLKQNVNAYMALATPRAQSAQSAALANFDSIWNYLVQECSNPQLGGAGQRCISDRQAGACHYKAADGTCWNWFVGYRDPIANDPNVVPDAQSAQAQSQTTTVQSTALPGPGGTVTTASASGSGVLAGFDSKTLLLVGALVLGAMYLGGGKN